VIFEIPIKYKASGRKKGNSINSTIAFQEMIEVDVPAVGDEDAPIVAEWDDTPPVETSLKSGWSVFPGEEREHVRFFGESYWRPLRVHEVAGGNDGLPITVGDFMTIAGGGGQRSVFPSYEITDRRFFAATQYFETVEHSERMKQVAFVRNAATDLLFVDGTVYSKCIEPMILVSMMFFEREWEPGRKLNFQGDVLRIVNRPQEGYQFIASETYPLHRFNEALGRSRKQNASRNRVKEVLNDLNAAKRPNRLGDYFLRPENASVSDCAIKLRQFLAVIDDKRQEMLPVADTTKMRLYCDLRDALAEMPAEHAMEVVEAAGSDYIRLYQVDRESNHQEQIFLKRAMKAASERPVELLISSGRPRPRIGE
jgi:hypothetical protein